MSWTYDDMPDLSGRTAVVTGANGGLGLETTLALAGAGARVVMAARNTDKAEAARAHVLAAHPGAELEVVTLDLGALSSVVACAQTILDDHRSVDVLVNNAGVMAMPEQRTVDGFEMQLGVDHLGHFVLTAHLLPALLGADAARVVTVTSGARLSAPPQDPGNPHLVGNYGAWRAYGQAKAANYHFARGLQRQFERAAVGAASLAAHPGLSNTDLQTTSANAGGAGPLGRLGVVGAQYVGMSARDGAQSQVRAATDPGASGGQLYGPRWGSFGPPTLRPLLRRRDLDRRIAELWEMSQRETGTTLDVSAVAPPTGADH